MTDSVTSCIDDKQACVREGEERKKEEKGETKEKREKMIRIFEKKKKVH